MQMLTVIFILTCKPPLKVASTACHCYLFAVSNSVLLFGQLCLCLALELAFMAKMFFLV